MKGSGSLTCFEGFCTAACRETEVKNKNASLPIPALLSPLLSTVLLHPLSHEGKLPASQLL